MTLTRTRLARLLGTAAAAASLAACATGATAPAPDLPPLAAGPFLGAASPAVSPDQAARDDWWRLYADPALDRLIARAFAENNDLQAAAANLRAVRASLSESRTARLPSTTLGAGYSYGRPSATTVPGAGDAALDETETYDVGLDAAWEIDLFGRVSAAIRAAGADADAAAAALDVVRVSVAAETARAYADACSANAQIAVAQRTVDLQQDTLDLTRRLLDGGVGTGLDTARAAAALQTSRAELPSLRARRDEALFRLAALTGVAPAAVDAEVRTCPAPPRLDRPVPVGDGAALLARRPDVRRAERALAAAAARADVAVAALYPSISLGASVGSTALAAGDHADDGAFRFSLGPLIRWSFPNVLAARARIAAGDARAEQALAVFDQTVLVALQETETALANYGHELDRRAALVEARDRAADAVRLSRLRFDAGADSFLTVLDAQRTLAQADAALARSEALVVSYQISLFKALAGGWAQT